MKRPNGTVFNACLNSGNVYCSLACGRSRPLNEHEMSQRLLTAAAAAQGIVGCLTAYLFRAAIPCRVGSVFLPYAYINFGAPVNKTEKPLVRSVDTQN